MVEVVNQSFFAGVLLWINNITTYIHLENWNLVLFGATGKWAKNQLGGYHKMRHNLRMLELNRWFDGFWALPLLRSQMPIGDSHHMDLYVRQGKKHHFTRNGSDQYHPTFVGDPWASIRIPCFFFSAAVLSSSQPTLRLWPLGVVLTRSWGAVCFFKKKQLEMWGFFLGWINKWWWI